MKVMVMGVVLIRCFNESKHMKEELIMKMDNWQYLGRLTIFGLNGGCTSRASTFSQSILLKWENWKIYEIFSGRIIVTLNLEIYDIIEALNLEISENHCDVKLGNLWDHCSVKLGNLGESLWRSTWKFMRSLWH